jgi:hypothetical protein
MILLEEIFSIGTRSKAWRRPMMMMNDDDDDDDDDDKFY